MVGKCLPTALQPSTSTGRGLQLGSRGLVDTCVEGCKLVIRFIQAGNGELGRGCRHFFSNCSKERRILEGKGEKKRIGITIGTSIYTLYTLNGWLSVHAGHILSKLQRAAA
jgi:hypothetical protein